MAAVHRTDAVFVGGGVIGLSAAWSAARRGIAVTVVDPAPGHGASWVAAGMLAPVSEAEFGEEPLTRLLIAGAARWPSFATELEDASGDEVGYRRCGTVMVAADASDRAVVDELVGYRRRLGLEATALTASACRALVPSLAPQIRGGAEIPGDHQVDNRRLVAALLTACRRAGVSFLPRRVTSIVTAADGSADGVELDDRSTVPAGAVVVVAGSETGLVGGVAPGVLPPVRPVKGHVVRLQGPADRPLLERTVRGLVHGRPCYLVPRHDGSVVVGATSEERGFDRSVQAGAVHALLDDARTLVPGIDELELVECLAGLRPGSPDNAPVVGWTSVARLAVASGHYRNGVLLAPLTADAIAAILSSGALPAAMAGFTPARLTAGPPARAGR
jgi:glycine oxidase